MSSIQYNDIWSPTYAPKANHTPAVRRPDLVDRFDHFNWDEDTLRKLWMARVKTEKKIDKDGNPGPRKQDHTYRWVNAAKKNCVPLVDLIEADLIAAE